GCPRTDNRDAIRQSGASAPDRRMLELATVRRSRSQSEARLHRCAIDRVELTDLRQELVARVADGLENQTRKSAGPLFTVPTPARHFSARCGSQWIAECIIPKEIRA